MEDNKIKKITNESGARLIKKSAINKKIGKLFKSKNLGKVKKTDKIKIPKARLVFI